MKCVFTVSVFLLVTSELAQAQWGGANYAGNPYSGWGFNWGTPWGWGNGWNNWGYYNNRIYFPPQVRSDYYYNPWAAYTYQLSQAQASWMPLYYPPQPYYNFNWRLGAGGYGYRYYYDECGQLRWYWYSY